ncbi:hypothetical protein FACS1894132_14460 [Clostridia bacterium]|nr:hypothetical protein FACS1894132_14460 [Clostridia bacterium]
MIALTKLNDTEFILNEDLIEIMEERPDTTIRLTNGNTYIAKETVDEVIKKIIYFKKQIFNR